MKNLLLLFILSVTELFGSEADSCKEDLIPYYKSGKWGLCDINLNIIVRPVYSEINLLGYGCAAARLNGKELLLNIKTGELFNSCEFDNIISYFLATHYPAPPYFEVELGGKKGLVDTVGNITVPIEYDKIFTRAEFEKKIIVVSRDNKKMIFTPAGKMISSREFDEVHIPFEGWVQFEINGKIGFIDLNTGNEITQFKYEFDPHWYFFSVKTEKFWPVKYRGKWGVINRDGAEVIPTVYDYINFINDEIIIADLNKKLGIIDSNNNVLIPFEYDNLSAVWDKTVRNLSHIQWNLSSYDLIAMGKGGKEFYFDSTIKPLPFSDYDYIDYLFLIDCFKVKKNGKYGIVDRNNKILVPLQYDRIYDLPSDSDYPQFKIISNNFTGLVDSRNWNRIEPSYEDILGSAEGLITIKQNNRIGFIDTLKRMVIPPVYEKAGQHFKHGRIAVKQNDGWGAINREGELVVPLEYDKIYIDEGVFQVSYNSKWGLLNLDGKQITCDQYDEIYSNGTEESFDSTFTITINNKRGIIDIKGNVIVPAEYDFVHLYKYPLYYAEKNGKRFFVKSGNIKFFEE